MKKEQHFMKWPTKVQIGILMMSRKELDQIENGCRIL